MRKALQAGRGRKWLGVTTAVGAFYATTFVWWHIRAAEINPLDAAQKVAFVAAAFSVTAYNLRTRVIDLILKISAHPDRISGLATIARSCGKRLTNLVLLFTVTAILLAAGGFVDADASFAKYYMAGCAGMLACSVVHFLYVIFAFERVESFVLDDAVAKSRDAEAKRILGSK